MVEQQPSTTGGVRTLVLLRHGRTAWNDSRRVQGQVDVELDDTGHVEAARTASVIAALRPTRLWSSDLARARQTAAYVAKEAGLDPVFDARLREFHLGERQGLTRDEYAAIDAAEFAQFRQGYYDAAPGGERTAAVRSRMLAVCQELLAEVGPGETAVAVSHGAAVRVAVGALLGWPDDQFHSLRGLDNCAWAVIGQHPDVRELRLAAYNRVVLPES